MTAALIISAGKTQSKDRLSPEKRVGNVSAIEREALNFKLAGIKRIVVVGSEQEPPQRLVPSMDLIFLMSSPENEMFDNIKYGLNYLKDKCTEVLIAYVDVPLFTGRTIKALLETPGDICIPSCKGHCGHPILLRASCFDNIISYNGTDGLRGAVNSLDVKKQIIETDDEGILADIHYCEPDKKLLADSDISKIRPMLKITIGREKVFYGPGAHQLIKLTEELGSLSSACQYMGISYSKGRKIISVMEEQLGVPILKTQQGGKSGGYSLLTDEAKELMERYNSLRCEAEENIRKLFNKYFP